MQFYIQKKNGDHYVFPTLSRSLHDIHHHRGLLSIPVILVLKEKSKSKANEQKFKER